MPDQRSDGLAGDHSAGGSVLTRERTGAIRFLDAASARLIVRAAARPVRLVDGRAAYDPLDPVSQTCCGHLGLALPDVRSLDVSAAEILARHRAGLLDLGDITRFSVETAATLRRHPFHGFETVGS
jgi:hypothetical protein